MNDSNAFERFVADQFHRARETTHAADSALGDITLGAARARQRPRWLALIKEPPMHTNSRLAVGSPTARLATILAATILLAVALAGVGVAGTRLLAADEDIVVAQDGSGDYSTISEAISAASDGDSILVRPGTYDEALLIDKDITVRGDGDRAGVVIERSGQLPQGLGKWGDPGLPYALRIEHSDAAIENLTLRGEASRLSIVGGSPTLSALTLQELGVLGIDAPAHDIRATWMAGVELMDGTTASLADSDVIDTILVIDTGASPTLEANLISSGWTLVQGDDVTPVIGGNTFENSVFESVWVGGGAKPEIVDNTFLSNVQRACVYVSDTLVRPEGPPRAGTDALIRGNSFRDCAVGVLMEHWTSATIEDNKFEGNTTGIRLEDADATIIGNAIEGGRTGMLITRGEPDLTDNSIAQNKVGLVLDRPAKPVMSGNVICDNEKNVHLMARAEMPDTEANEICADTSASG
jgi:F-box protein 11